MQFCSSLNIFWHWPFLGLEWKLTFSSPVATAVFQICWHIECNTFTATSFRIWNSSTGIPSPPLALFEVMLPKAHLTSHSRMSGSRWVITALWISGSWRSFCITGSAGEGNDKPLQYSCLENPMNRMKRQKELRSIWFRILLLSLPIMVEQTRVIITVGQWVQYSRRNSYFKKSYFMSRPRNRMCKLNINCLDQEENKHCQSGKTPRATVPALYESSRGTSSLKARLPNLRVGQSSFQLCVWMEAHSFIKKPILDRESKQLSVFGSMAIQHFLFE